MNRPTDPSRPAAPAVREIAALTARLREITSRGREVDPAERAQFLAAKDALIARITATEAERGRAALRERYAMQDALAEHDVADAAPVDEAGAQGVVVHRFDPAEAYTDAEIGEIADAHARGDDAEVARLEDGRPSLVPGRAEGGLPTEVATPEVEMPGWMREQARRTEAEIAAGTYMPGPPDDMDRLAARLTELRATRTAAPPDVEADRREQLARWHTDDTTTDHDRRTSDAPVRALDEGAPSTAEEW